MSYFKKIFFGLFIILSLLAPSASFAWNSLGHRLIDQIAYDNLLPKTKKQVDVLSKQMRKLYPKFSYFSSMGVLPDALKARGITAFNSWHFIDLPYTQGGVVGKPINKENVVWAINQTQNILTDSQASPSEKAFFLAFLMHFVGDVHQPLHCITLYNKRFPQGDRGGNLYPIKTKYAKNLHSYWDKGLNFSNHYYHNYPLKYRQLKQLALTLQREYPKSKMKAAIQITDPAAWAQESFHLAKNFVYTTPIGKKPSAAYTQKGQALAKQRIVLAGYRLAYLLNHAY